MTTKEFDFLTWVLILATFALALGFKVTAAGGYFVVGFRLMRAVRGLSS